jgi:hypothetical protein
MPASDPLARVCVRLRRSAPGLRLRATHRRFEGATCPRRDQTGSKLGGRDAPGFAPNMPSENDANPLEGRGFLVENDPRYTSPRRALSTFSCWMGWTQGDEGQMEGQARCPGIGIIGARHSSVCGPACGGFHGHAATAGARRTASANVGSCPYAVTTRSVVRVQARPRLR